MVQNTNHSLDEKLNKFMEKNVIVTQDGFLKNKYSIHKLKYFIEYEILNITDEESENYLKINLNQIYKMEINEKDITLFLDNDTIICLSI
ncbi:MAG: hypothetical protein ACLR9X_04565 [Clostridia bacterium]